ncbi:MAG: autotransporter outer membrane beta-barrel domain-containing protein [Candidatus Anaerobiospirillum pullicola]|uniref:Autotransporter outer membrane beta-barrel domain-containing protein n=1 Tax=Candidatus Anaerobiospirillum pullicola TaxID=2838451 RepID=A0A948X019_9GAMM|nr:autotransporter outer membrane beta-barrel domain-containing protein [Candidatus Anaerobiospirillum pullicola]
MSPICKSSKSNGFDAKGVDYGVNMDLYGVALGADYTLSNGLRVGAMFNLGSGDADGQGAGSLASNDFDYYGFGLYAGYTIGQLSVVGDITYTAVDNDVEATLGSFDTVGASLDSTNLSVGVTGKYEFDYNGLYVTPHACLRYSTIDIDDYDVSGRDTYAHFASDSLDVFSIPVGVTVAKEFVAGTWTVKPSFDVTLTGNFGDDSFDGEVDWVGISNVNTATSTEVLDNFTYGATLGVGAKTGNFSLGLGVNYTGSSNVDDFGVNANARYVF